MKKWIGIMLAGLLTAAAGFASLITGGTAITNGAGSVQSDRSADARSVCGEVFALTGGNYSAGKMIGIKGAMTLSGYTPPGTFGDRLGIILGNSSAVFPAAGTNAPFLSATTVTYPGANERSVFFLNGVQTQTNLIATATASQTVNYCINIIFPSNFANGVDALDHVYTYTFGYDFNRDGTYEMTSSGTFNVYEDDTIRLGFYAAKSSTAMAYAAKNTYTYDIYAIPEPATIELSGSGAQILPRMLHAEPPPIETGRPVPSYLKGYESLYAKDPQAAALQWFRDARFGLMIHYGLCSIDGIHPFAQWQDKIPVREYEKKMDRFTASGFDANAIADLVQKTGMKYITLVTKHCEGFCLWDTRQTTFNSMNSAAKRDLVREMAQACEKRGLGLFLFYEHGFEWHHPHGPRAKDWRCKLTEVPYSEPEPTYAHGDEYDMNKYVDYVYAQITELLTQYGSVAGIWLDGYAVPASGDHSKFRLPELYDQIHRLQPQALVSYKWGITGTEDFLAPELSWFSKGMKQEGDVVNTDETNTRLAQAKKDGKPVEANATLTPHWFYTKNASKLNNAGRALNDIKRVRSLGINYLLNIGPLPDGSISSEGVQVLETIGEAVRKDKLLED